MGPFLMTVPFIEKILYSFILLTLFDVLSGDQNNVLMVKYRQTSRV